jgi:hypothetical protein
MPLISFQKDQLAVLQRPQPVQHRPAQQIVEPATGACSRR